MLIRISLPAPGSNWPKIGNRALPTTPAGWDPSMNRYFQGFSRFSLAEVFFLSSLRVKVGYWC